MTDKVLASGNRSSSDLYTMYSVPSNQSASINPLLLVNQSANTITVKLYWNDGTDRGGVRVKIPKGDGNTVTVLNMPFALSGGFSLKIQPETSDSFDYVLTGSEG